MSIVDEIRKKIRANGGSAGKVKDIASGVKALETGGQGVFYRLDATISWSGDDYAVTVSKTVPEVFELVESGYVPYMCLVDEATSTVYHSILHLGYYSYNDDEPYEIEFDSVYESSREPYWSVRGFLDSDVYKWQKV